MSACICVERFACIMQCWKIHSVFLFFFLQCLKVCEAFVLFRGFLSLLSHKIVGDCHLFKEEMQNNYSKILAVFIPRVDVSVCVFVYVRVCVCGSVCLDSLVGLAAGRKFWGNFFAAAHITRAQIKALTHTHTLPSQPQPNE